MATRRKRGDWFYFVVEGNGSFPFDMLRYDSCWPVREGYDSAKLEHHNGERRMVMLVTCSDGAPTPPRWASFLWKVVAQSADRYDCERFIQEATKA